MKQYAYPSISVQRRAEAIRAQIGHDPLYMTLLADLTTLSSRCEFVLEADGTLVARYRDLPFAAVSFYGQGAGLRRALRAILDASLDADQACYALIGEAQRDQLAAVTQVRHVYDEWQMIYRGDPASLWVGDTVPLGEADLSAMRVLAERGGLHAFESNALEKGPYFGVWRDGRLASMAGTHLKLERLVEVGNVVTDPDFRRLGLASMAVSAVTRTLCAEGLVVILQVLKSNEAAIAVYEKLGFERERTMYLVEFEL
jgi:ribosomal protein S18 acetylase RimI-like enzyme